MRRPTIYPGAWLEKNWDRNTHISRGLYTVFWKSQVLSLINLVVKYWRGWWVREGSTGSKTTTVKHWYTWTLGLEKRKIWTRSGLTDPPAGPGGLTCGSFLGFVLFCFSYFDHHLSVSWPKMFGTIRNLEDCESGLVFRLTLCHSWSSTTGDITKKIIFIHIILEDFAHD